MKPTWEDMSNPVVRVVQPLIEDAKKRAREEAQKIVEKVTKELAEAGNDVQKCAPYPSSWNASRDAYAAGLRKYKMFSALTKWRESSYSPREPHWADVDAERVAKYIKDAEEAAALQYNQFIAKLVRKVGIVKKAKLEGNHIWGYSFLTVTTEAGEQVIWKTCQIVNVSKLGLLFNQWPTRKVKNKN